jgi:hypothetical protein
MPLLWRTMPSKVDRAAEFVGDAVGTIETAAATAGSRVEQGLSEAATVIAGSKAADRIETKTRPIRKAAAKRASKIQKAAKKRASTATRKASGAKKSAKKRAQVRR